MEIHALASSAGAAESDIFVGAALVDMYAKSGSLLDARLAFDRMGHHDVVAWTSLILAYVERGEPLLALHLFYSMPDRCNPNARTIMAAFMACASLADEERAAIVDARSLKVASLDRARSIHALARRCLLEHDPFVASAAVEAFARCGSVDEARRIFDRVPCHSAPLRNSLAIGYAESRGEEEALAIVSASPCWDPRAVVAALTACASARDLERGMAIHRAALGIQDADLFVATALLAMYASCGSLADARRVFDRMPRHNVVAWTSLILGCAHNAEPRLALDLFDAMGRQRCDPNARTFVAALTACTTLASSSPSCSSHNFGSDGGGDGSATKIKLFCLARGKEIHSRAAALGHDSDTFVANTLVALYAKCGDLAAARAAFDAIPIQRRTPVSWHALMLGYVDNEQHNCALDLFAEMAPPPTSDSLPQKISDSLPLDSLTLVAALMAAAGLASLESGRELHARALRLGLESDPALANSLVDLYGKCGDMIAAQHVFDSDSSSGSSLPRWNALIAGYSRLGHPALAIELFYELGDCGLQGDDATFLSILATCSHSGLVELGIGFLERMIRSARIKPSVAHYTCVVDMFGRVNQLRRAVEILESMPCAADAVAWTSVLAACNKWKNVEFGKLAFEKVVELDEENKSTPYVLMASIYGNNRVSCKQ